MLGALRGKTVRRNEPHVDLVQRLIPDGVLQRHKEVTICFDVMFANEIAFLVSGCRYIKFCTAEALENRRNETMLTGLKRVKMVYARRGLIVSQAAGDNEFQSLEAGISDIGVALNVVSRDEHVSEVDRHIRTLKERCRSTYNSLPFTKLPSRMAVELVYAMTFWIHVFPSQDGVSNSMSPREIITGVPIDADKHCVIPFGAYAQTHEQHDKNMESRTIGAIALRPTGNAQEGHFFYNLQTGKHISRNRWTELPMPTEVVRRIHQMAKSPNTNTLTFGNRNNGEDDDANDTAYNVDSDSSSESGSTSSEADSNEDENHDDGADGDDAHPGRHEEELQDHDSPRDEAPDKPLPMVKEEEDKLVAESDNGHQPNQ